MRALHRLPGPEIPREDTDAAVPSRPHLQREVGDQQHARRAELSRLREHEVDEDRE